MNKEPTALQLRIALDNLSQVGDRCLDLHRQLRRVERERDQWAHGYQRLAAQVLRQRDEITRLRQRIDR